MNDAQPADRWRVQQDAAARQMFTRRRVLIGGMTVAIGLTLPELASAAAAKTSGAPRARTGGLKRARFEPHAGTTVKLRPAGAPAVPAQLVAVEDLAGESVRHLAGSQNAYALRFRVASSLQTLQGTVGVRHPRFGVVRLFVTPSTRTSRHQDYIAVVNRVLG